MKFRIGNILLLRMSIAVSEHSMREVGGFPKLGGTYGYYNGQSNGKENGK